MHELVLPKDTTVREIWRIGLVAYRNAARQELKVSQCHNAAAAAICAKYPELTERQARWHSIEAVAWASKRHRAWLDRGAPRHEWIWAPDRRGVGLHRNPGFEVT
jgi:hypothetical protein